MKETDFFSKQNINRRLYLSTTLEFLGYESTKVMLGVFDALDDPVFIVDTDGRICYFNKAYYKSYGSRLEEWGCTLETLCGLFLPNLDKDGFEPVLQAMQLQQPILKKEFLGNEHYFSDIIPLQLNGQSCGALVICRSSTDIVEMSKQVKYYRDMANEYNQELKAKESLPLPFRSVIGSSPAFLKILRTAAQVAPTKASICISGESGTGKEVLATAIHFSSKCADGPFIKVNCAAIPENLLESELFGYEKGAFTGARATGNPGKFELADRGTLFLDEIGEMPPAMQVKLLRVLQDQEVTRLGGTRPIKLNFRLITATNRDLQAMVKSGEFREDLYYRISVIPLACPPLRQRRTDIPKLINHFLAELRDQYGGNPALSGDAILLMTEYSWPGNTRELKNCVERMVVLSDSDEITSENLPAQIREQKQMPEKPIPLEDYNLQSILEETERNTIQTVLRLSDGNKTKAIEILGMSKRNFYMKLDKYELR